MKWQQGKYFATKRYHHLLSPHKRMHCWLMGYVFHPGSILLWNGPKIMTLTDICKCFVWHKERKADCSYCQSQSTRKTTWLFSLCNVTNYYQRFNATISNLYHSPEQLHPELYVPTGKVDSNADAGCMLKSNTSELQKFHLVMKIISGGYVTQLLLGSQLQKSKIFSSIKLL